ncbi:MAG: metal-dependent transcriptional regulator [Clostridia bacterium]|nr:metal-dependent transcriptional regulator [Clostridia bacterium]
MAPDSKITPSLEDYLEDVFDLLQLEGRARVTDAATRPGVSRASVNQAMGVLENHGLIAQEKYGPLYLIEEGLGQASTVRGRHSVIKWFLVSILGVDESIAEEDACRIEHAVSQQTMDRLLEFMGKHRLP